MGAQIIYKFKIKSINEQQWSNKPASSYLCTQCNRQTIAPFVMRCYHFICLTCLKEYIRNFNCDMDNEIRCRVCGLFTTISHLKKLIIGNKSLSLLQDEYSFTPRIEDSKSTGRPEKDELRLQTTLNK